MTQTLLSPPTSPEGKDQHGLRKMQSFDDIIHKFDQYRQQLNEGATVEDISQDIQREKEERERKAAEARRREEEEAARKKGNEGWRTSMWNMLRGSKDPHSSKSNKSDTSIAPTDSTSVDIQHHPPAPPSSSTVPVASTTSDEASSDRTNKSGSEHGPGIWRRVSIWGNSATKSNSPAKS